MSAPAKGAFPGRPKRKNEKKKAKFKHSLHRKEFEDLKLTCSFITNISHQFHRIFDDENEEDIEFVGFSSEECGLQAYKKVSRKKSSSVVSPSHSDILYSHQTYNKEQVTTRSSHARESLSSPEKDYTSPKRPSFIFNKDAESSSGSSDAAFLKYNDFKLDFHRLSKKAKNRDEISPEDQAKRKDTSVASLKYASEIYLAKHQDVAQNVTRSPIKPATFILPPTLSKKLYASMSGNTSMMIKKASKLKEMHDLKKGAGHPHTLAKALLARANRQSRKNSSDSASNKPRTTKTFVLPTKSTRSSRIIKANRKYLDQDSSKAAKSVKSNGGKECVVEVPRLLTQSDLEQENKMVVQRLNDNEHKSPRKPLIKEPTFYANDNKIWNDQLGPSGKKSKYKLPSFTEPICIDDSNSDDTYHNQKQFIKQATFMGPKKNETALGIFGLKSDELKRLLKPNFSTWNLNKTEHKIPNWTVQEIHNILHGVHTFGGLAEHNSAWPSIARQYEFHELHRDWKSVKEKLRDCVSVGLMSSEQKIENAIFAKLNPKLSANPNITVLTPQELNDRGMTCNITYDLTKIESLNKKEVPLNKKQNKQDKDLYLGLGFKEFHALLKPRKPPVQKWSSWEIHNILHGVHYFGLYNWHKIMKFYKFKPGRDAVVLRGRLKAACCRGLFKDGSLSSEVALMLHPMLKKQGKNYFAKHNISVNGYSPSHDSEDNFTSSSPYKPKKGRLKQPSFDEAGSLIALGSDSQLSSPNQNRIVSDDSTSTPVLRALEDGLRRNKTPTSPVKHQTGTTSGLSSPNNITSPPRTTSNSEVVTDTIVTPPAQSGASQIRKTSKEETPVSTANSKGKGPRIKHVCRRASLVTGHAQATYEDHAPHLSALPRGEREKVIAQSEKEKVQISRFTSSESELDCKISQKTTVVNHHIRKERAKKKATFLLTRCKNCEACLTPPCGECEACKSTKENEESNDAICLKLEACTNPVPENSNKKNKRPLPEQHAGSRKSSRLQQQRVPLKSSRVTDIPVTSSLLLANPMTSLMTSPNFNQSMAHYLKNNSHISILSPTSQNRAYQDFKARQAIVRIDNWKETYDFDLLWKTGGRALITSHPPPPRVTCFLCGSFYLSGVQDATMLYCSCCCEPFHHYCVGIKSSAVRKYSDNKRWICRRCQYCRVCGHTKNLLECKRCKKAYHSECLGPSYPTVPSESNVWVCMQCVRCQSCGTSKPGTLPGSTWTHDFTMCQRCGDLFDKGNYCPICERCYSDEDFDTRMVQCAGCKRWVHSKCENLSVEMYTLLSYMPDNVQYNCPDCDSRGQKLNAILEESLNHDTGDRKDQQPDAEKIRSILAQLPPPKWKKLMESEIQSGLEAITMALFHNRAIFCVLKKNGSNMDTFASSPLHCPSPTQQQDPDSANKLRSQDLFAVRFAVHNHKYQSVGAFCSDVRTILDTVTDEADRISVGRAFLEEANSIFSWFNFETGRVRDLDDMPEDLLPNATMPPLPEHNYAQWQDKDITIFPGTPTQSPMKPLGVNTPLKAVSPFEGAEDLRQCLMCNNYGDDYPRMCGRLLYCGQDEWCHVNCALWSAEVYEQHDGSLQNVHSAASRGRMMRCDDCRLPGATLGCNTRDCPKSFHFKCARQVDCAFLENKQVFCPKHRSHAKKELVRNSEFEVARLVCIDNDEMRPNRRWQRGVSAGSVTVTIGSLTVHQLGGLGRSSDTKECLLPVSYRMTRVFWSAFSVTRKVVYTITITERKPSLDNNTGLEGKLNEEDYHLTISHTNDEAFSKMTPKTSRKQSEDSSSSHRSNLLSKMEDSESHIGPLSPRSASGKRKSSKEGGRYTIMSSLNKTLPQQVTPHPVFTAQTQNSHNPNSAAVASAKVTPGNPFLNSNLSQPNERGNDLTLHEVKPVFKHTALQNSLFDSSSTKTEQLSQKISFNSNLGGESVSKNVTEPKATSQDATSITSNKNYTNTLPQKVGIATRDIMLPVAKTAVEDNIAATHVNSDQSKDQPIRHWDEPSTPAIPLQAGLSGGLILPLKFENCEKLPIVKNENESIIPVLPNIVASALQNNSDHAQTTASKAGVDLNKTTLERNSSGGLLEQAKSEGNVLEENSDNIDDKNLVQKDKLFHSFSNKAVDPDCKPTDNSSSPPVVNLLVSAKLAHQTEVAKQVKTTPKVDPTSGLWWRKGNQSSNSRVEKKGTPSVGTDVLEKEPRMTRRGRSYDEDFVFSKSADPVWRRKPGEMKSDVAKRAITRQGNDHLRQFEEVDFEIKSEDDIEEQAKSICKNDSRTATTSQVRDLGVNKDLLDSVVEDSRNIMEDSGDLLEDSGDSGSLEEKKIKSENKAISETDNQIKTLENKDLNTKKDGIMNKNEDVCIENLPKVGSDSFSDINGGEFAEAINNENIEDEKSPSENGNLRNKSENESCKSGDASISNPQQESGNGVVTESKNETSLKKTKKLSAYALPALAQKTNKDPENIETNQLKLSENLKQEDHDCDKFEELDLNIAGADLINDDSLSNFSTSSVSEHTKSSEKPTNRIDIISQEDKMSVVSMESEETNKKEMTKTKLRKFSSTVDETRRVTRSSRMRSKSHDAAALALKKFGAEKNLQPTVSLTKIIMGMDTKEPHSHCVGGEMENNGSKNPENDSSPRRYPRRNTYTCLKSFSGLSPNYALASYSRMQEKERAKTKSRGSRKKLKPLKKSDKKTTVLDKTGGKEAEFENNCDDTVEIEGNNLHTEVDEQTETEEQSQLSHQNVTDNNVGSPTNSSNSENVSINANKFTPTLSEMSSTATNQVIDVKNDILEGSNVTGCIPGQDKACDREKTLATATNIAEVNSSLDCSKNVEENQSLKEQTYSGIQADENIEISDSGITIENGEEIKYIAKSSVDASTDGEENKGGKMNLDTNAIAEKHDLSSDEKCVNQEAELESFGKEHLKEGDTNEVSKEEGIAIQPETCKNSNESPSNIPLPRPSLSEPQKLVSRTPLFQANSESIQQPFVDQSVDLPPFKPTEDLSILEDLESMSESVEIFRGGSPENNNSVSDFNQSLPVLSSSPLSKSFGLNSCDQDEDLAGPSEMDIVEPNDAALESMKNDASFHTATECPVLNADEVKTLLEEPVTSKPDYQYVQQNLPQQQTAMNFPPPITQSPINMVYSIGPKLYAPQQVFQAPYCVDLPVMSPLNVAQMPQYQQVTNNQNMMYNPPNHPGMSGSVLSPASPGFMMTNQPQMYQPANPQIMIPNPVQCNAVDTGLPYSVRVTMAMAGSTNQNFQMSTTKNVQKRMDAPVQINQSFVTEKQDFNSAGYLAANQQPITRSAQFTPPSSLQRNNGRLNKQKNAQPKLQQHKLEIQKQPQLQQNQQQQQSPTVQQQQAAVPQKQQLISKTPQQHSEQEAALESLIDFYSAKNNLNANERAVVRSIIKSQIQTNQLPMPSGDSNSDLSVKNEKMAAKRTLSNKSNNTTDNRATKRRLSSQDNQRKKTKTTKKTRSNELDIMKENKIEYLDTESYKENEVSDTCSVLVDVYNNRKKLALNEKKPLSQVMSAYNIYLGDHKAANKENRIPPPQTGSKEETGTLVYEIKSDDGYLEKGTDLDELVTQLFTAVQECHSSVKGTTPTIVLNQVMTPAMFLGVSHDAVRYLVEQLPGARNCHRYRAKYHKHKKAKTEITHINPHGCCRAEQYKGRSKPDMFSFLASKHRSPPEFQPERSQDDALSSLSNRRATSMEQLPMAMRFRHLRTFSHEAVGVFRSSIHGRGLFCKRDFEAGEMIMEYTGQKIRRLLTDKREKYYESKQIGCYMFRMDDHYVVDATILGNGARFINHCCEPNCYSRIVSIEGNKHIVIFALRKLYRGEELTYDYKFPIEDAAQKITCNCGARLCRKFMN